MHDIIANLSQYDTATVFNALVLKMGLPNEEYTDHWGAAQIGGRYDVHRGINPPATSSAP